MLANTFGSIGVKLLRVSKTGYKPLRWSCKQMSSLGNPMFPQRPLPELETFEESVENAKKSKGSSSGKPGDKGVVDILADHGGKIALLVFGGIAALIYSYYKSGKDRNRIEDEISEAVFVEPYEIQELRYYNQLNVGEYQQVVSQAKRAFPSNRATYAEFMRFLKHDVVITDTDNSNVDTAGEERAVWPVGGRLTVHLRATHLLDRIAMGLSLAHARASDAHTQTPNSTPEAHTATRDTSHDRSAEPSTAAQTTHSVAWAEEPLDLDLLLVMLSLTMVPDSEARVIALFHLAGSSSGNQSERTSRPGEAETGQDEAQGTTEICVAREELLAMVRHLIATDQVPPAKQTIENGVRWPVKLHRRRHEADMLTDYEVKKKITEPVQKFTYETFKEVLQGYQVCAWGDCYGRDPNR